MTDRADKPDAAESVTIKDDETSPRKLRYEAPSCEKKRSIHRVTLLSGMGVMSVGVLSMTN